MWTTTLDPYAEELDACAAILDALLESGADVDAVDRDGSTALHRAVEIKHADAIDRILAKGASLTQSGKFIGTGNTALHHATRVGDVGGVTKILSAARARNLDVETFADAPGAGGWSALGMAVRVNNTGVVDALLAHGARGDALMGNGKTPLEIARVNERVAIVDAIEKTL